MFYMIFDELLGEIKKRDEIGVRQPNVAFCQCEMGEGNLPLMDSSVDKRMNFKGIYSLIGAIYEVGNYLDSHA